MSMGCDSKTVCADQIPGPQELAAAQFLIDMGFRPTPECGMVRHISTGRNLGRTLGSVWRAMVLLSVRTGEGLNKPPDRVRDANAIGDS
jgi:hypothetical protein